MDKMLPSWMLLQGSREMGAGGQIAIGPQAQRGLITPYPSRYGGPYKVNQLLFSKANL